MRKFYLAGILLLLLVGIASAGTSYIHGANGQLIARINETGNVTYYHTDHVGSTSVITDEKGEVVEEQVDLPFGERVSGDEKIGFTGKELNSNGLMYYGARYYDPLTGRFITSDDAKDGLNWFAYAADNPMKYVDPDGNYIDELGKIDYFEDGFRISPGYSPLWIYPLAEFNKGVQFGKFTFSRGEGHKQYGYIVGRDTDTNRLSVSYLGPPLTRIRDLSKDILDRREIKSIPGIEYDSYNVLSVFKIKNRIFLSIERKTKDTSLIRENDKEEWWDYRGFWVVPTKEEGTPEDIIYYYHGRRYTDTHRGVHLRKGDRSIIVNKYNLKHEGKKLTDRFLLTYKSDGQFSKIYSITGLETRGDIESRRIELNSGDPYNKYLINIVDTFWEISNINRFRKK